jgi:hypothetical protein
MSDAQRKNIRFTMMLSALEDRILKRAAEKEGLSKASVVRKLIRDWASVEKERR